MATDSSGLTGGRGRFAVGLLLALLVAVAFLGLRQSAPFATIEGQALDWRFRLRGPVPPGPDVAIVTIDDRTLQRLGPWPVPRDDLADILLAIGRGGARVVAVDLLLGENAQAGNDRRLAEALSIVGKSAVAFAFSMRDEPATPVPPALAAESFRIAHATDRGDRTLMLHPTGFVAPGRAILSKAAAGHVNVVLDVDGQLRYALPALRYGDAYYPSLPIAAVRLWRNVGAGEMAVRLGEAIANGDVVLPTDAQTRQVVDYYGPVGSFPTYSAIDVLDGRVPPGALRDKLVIVGAAATGIGDVFATPFSPVMPGVEYFATIADNALQQHFVRHDDTTRALDLVIVAVLGAIAALVGAKLRPATGIATLGALAVLFAVANYAAFAFGGLWLNITFPLLALILVASWNLVAHALHEGRLREVAERRGTVLARLVSPVAERAAAGPGSVPREAAVLFVDIRGFTTLAETMAPAAAMALLRSFHRDVEETVDRNHGVVDKFLGDGAMAVFGLDGGGPVAARDALACATELARRYGGPRAGDDPQHAFAIGIGVHYGPVEVGEIGGVGRADVTVGGDTVNVASRLETLTRDLAVDVVASDDAVAAARASDGVSVLDDFVALPDQLIRGRRAPVRAWAWSVGGGAAAG